MKQELSRKQQRKAKKEQKKAKRIEHQQHISKRKTQMFIKSVKNRGKKNYSKKLEKINTDGQEGNFMEEEGEFENFGSQQQDRYHDQVEEMYNQQENQQEYEEDGDQEMYQQQYDQEINSDDKQIELLQQKLGLNKKSKKSTKYQKIAKGLGFDDDLFSFLDNISKKVKEPSSSKKEKSTKSKQKQKQKQKSKKQKKNVQQTKIQPQKMQKQQQDKQQMQNLQIYKHPDNKPKLFSNNISPQTLAIKKLMNSLFNKISDGNLNITLREFINIFQGYPKSQTIPIFAQLFTKFNLLVEKPLTHILTANIVMAVAITMIYGSRIMVVLLKQLIEGYKTLQNQQQNYEQVQELGYSKLWQKKKNFITIICYFYQFGAITGQFIQSLIQNLTYQPSTTTTTLSPQKIEYLYIILQKCGQKLRNNDTTILKNILQIMKQIIQKSKQTSMYQNTKIKFIEIQINQIKFNRKSVFDADQRMGFLHNFLNKGVNAEAPVIQNKEYVMLYTYEQIAEADMQVPQWWEMSKENTNKKVDNNIQIKLPDTQQIKQLKQLAKNYHFVTQIRRNIFVELMSSKDYIQATHKILELKVKRLEEIATVLVETNIRQPEAFNPFYALTVCKICEEIPKFRVSVQFAIWDRIKQLESYGREEQNLRKISNLGKFVGWVLSSEIANCSLTILKYFTDLGNLSVYQSVFVKIAFKELFRKSTKAHLIKLTNKLKDPKNKGIRINIKQYLDDLQSEYQNNTTNNNKQVQSLQKSLKFMRKLILLQEDQQLQMN